MDQLLRSTAATIAVEFRDSAFNLVDATGAVPVAIMDGGGTAVTSGNATHGTVGQYSFTLTPTQTANLDVYTATWTPTIGGNVNTYVTEFEVVGGWYFSITEARNYVGMGGDPGLDDTTEISTQQIVDTRALVEERFERECSAAFVPRGARTVVDGDPWNPSRLVLRRPDTAAPVSRIRKVNGLTLDGVAFTAPQLAALSIYADEGAIQTVSASFFGFGYRNIQVWYEHGYDQAPLPIKRAALEYSRYLLLNNQSDEQQINVANEMMTPSGGFMGPGRYSPTGLKTVDVVLRRYSDRVPGFA